ncbi:MAG TPA: nucleotide disphospho-sugar-binding domain-containing protein [Acetobacteraceae bacterium]|nr:nucleotide disphospho-sugar-binding domain-containing protein [Acetobacteraceae bacterium]
MKILMASTPAAGHINPLLAIGRVLIDDGHELVCLSGSWLRDRIEGAGMQFRALAPAADLDLRDILAVAPELATIPPGLEWLRVAKERFFLDRVAPQYESLLAVLRAFPADVIVADNTLFGVLPMLLGRRDRRPPVVVCGTSFLHWTRDDGAPHFLGLPPATTQAERDRYATIAAEYDRAVDQPTNRRLTRILKGFGARPLALPLFDAIVALADAYMQLSVPGFEFPRPMPPTVHFIGTPPIISGQAPLPPWAHELDGSRRIVLVTQGTVANHNLGLLVAPTLAALGNETDVLVVATTGGRPVDAIPGAIPDNARVASFLPFEWLLPKVDVLVTNGGYGSVNQALSFGVPLVTAGLTEDKADVNARVAWSGVGVNLATNEPKPSALRAAVRSVLDTPHHRARAAAMAEEFRRIDTRAEILGIIDRVVHAPDDEADPYDVAVGEASRRASAEIQFGDWV